MYAVCTLSVIKSIISCEMFVLFLLLIVLSVHQVGNLVVYVTLLQIQHGINRPYIIRPPHDVCLVGIKALTQTWLEVIVYVFTDAGTAE